MILNNVPLAPLLLDDRPHSYTHQEFLNLLARNQEITFQTFGDKNKSDAKLSRILHGSLGTHLNALTSLNKQGAGIFFMVNQGDLKGRSKANVTAIRALFVDLDGSPLAPVTSCAIPPHITVESSQGRYHAYWLVDDCPLDMFTQLQLALAIKFDGDKSVKDLPRVMRLPCFYHNKAEPFQSRILSLDVERPAYSLDELVGGLKLEFDLSAPARFNHDESQLIIEGQRNNALASLAGGMRADGLEQMQIKDRLVEINQTYCQPPLPESEVSAIAYSIAQYPPRPSSKGSATMNKPNKKYAYQMFMINAADILSNESYVFMTPAELGTWLRLMCLCWQNDDLPADNNKLAHLLHMNLTDFDANYTEAVSSQFIAADDGRIYSEYLRECREDERRDAAIKSMSGRRGGQATQAKNRAAVTQH